jgi:hypothetical protein
MLAEKTNIKNPWQVSMGEGPATYIPSVLLLLMAIDNDWEIIKIRLEPSHDQHGFVYLVTLKIFPEGHSQELIIPKSALVEKIFEQNAPSMVPVC